MVALKSVNKRFSPLKRRSESAAYSFHLPHRFLQSAKMYLASETAYFAHSANASFDGVGIILK